MMQSVRSHLSRVAAAVLLAAAAVGAQAEAALQISFVEPTGTVGPTDTIPLWIRLTSVGDEAFSFDTSLGFDDMFGLPSSVVLPSEGQDFTQAGPPQLIEFASYTSISLFTWRSCNDSFSNGCSPASHAFVSPDGPSNWFAQEQFSLAPGDTLDIHHSDLVPVGGMAPEGTYTATNLGVGVTLHGLSADGVALETDLFSFGTCSGGEPGCGFTRTVVGVVPEPGTWALMLGGLGLVGLGAARRRRSTV
jgi:hypothetical protein